MPTGGPEPDPGLNACFRFLSGAVTSPCVHQAYSDLGKGAGHDAFTSIVLMTDGENTTGADARDFDAFYAELPQARRDTPVFPIVFGD